MSIREQTVYGKVARNILVKSHEMLSYVARNCVILNNIVVSLLPFTTLVSSQRRIIYNYITHYIPLVSSQRRIIYNYITHYIPLVSSQRRIIYNYITYYIPLVSSHHCLKNEACYTFIPLVSSHDGLKNQTFKNRHSLFNTN